MSEQRVVLTGADGIAVITLNRPQVRNAIDLPAAKEIAAALDELDRRDDLRVGVITGAGGTFSAGMDLKALVATGERPIVDDRGAFGIVKRPPSKPLLAAVEGFALGGGFEIALACDMIVAGRGATFGLPEVKRGLSAAAGGVIRLPRRIPYGFAQELILTGAPLAAERAAELGLVNRLTDEGGALESARELAAEIAANAPLAVRISKQIVAECQTLSISEAFEHQEPLIEQVRGSADAEEGARAFAEKRDPVWSGR